VNSGDHTIAKANCNSVRNIATIITTAAGHGFTLVELLVVIGVVGLLALSLFPVFGSTVQKGGRMQCAANLRQIGASSMMYANDFQTWLPIWQDASHPRNVIRQFHYTVYVSLAGIANMQLPKSYTNVYTQAGGTYQNMGYLYAGRYVNSGEVLFCPGQWQVNNSLSAVSYLPLITTGNMGHVSSSYSYNPRLIDPDNNNLRRFEKTAQLEPQKLLTVDYFDSNPAAFAHLRERGWNVLLTDASVRFSSSDRAYSMLKSLISFPEVPLTAVGAVLDALESDR
jgi:prepilin-type N-terminal cleavage/methylation domain-containing protein